MPYRKRIYRRKRTFKRKAVGTAKMYQIAKKVLTKQKEVKSYDDYFALSAVNNNVGQVYPMFNSLANGGGIIEGVTEETRVGSTIFAKNLGFRATLKLGTSTNQVVRIIIFRYKNDDSRTLTNANDLLQGSGVNARKKWDERFQSKFLFDRTYTLSTAKQPWVQIDTNIKVFHRLNYKAGTASSYEDGGLYMLLISDNSGSSFGPVLDATYTLSYTDL